MNTVVKPLLALGLATGLVSCATNSTIPPITLEGPFTPPQVAAVSVSQPILTQAYGSASEEQIGLLRVPDGKGPFPVAMLVHGGCWRDFGSPRAMGPLADWLAANGVASWAIGYREFGSGGEWPNLFRDWAAGLSHLSTLSGRYPLDMNRVSVIGHSAGGAAPVWLAMADPGEELGIENLPKVTGVAVLDAPLDLAHYAREEMAGLCSEVSLGPVMGGLPDDVPQNYAMIDAASQGVVVERMLLVEGTEPLPSDDIVQVLRSNDTEVETVALGQQRHFDMMVPGTADFALIAKPLLRVAKGD